MDILPKLAGVIGVAGVALGVLVLVYRDVIALRIFPQLEAVQAYRLIRLIVVLTFAIAVAGVGAWVYLDVLHTDASRAHVEVRLPPRSEPASNRAVFTATGPASGDTSSGTRGAHTMPGAKGGRALANAAQADAGANVAHADEGGQIDVSLSQGQSVCLRIVRAAAGDAIETSTECGRSPSDQSLVGITNAETVERFVTSLLNSKRYYLMPALQAYRNNPTPANWKLVVTETALVQRQLNAAIDAVYQYDQSGLPRPDTTVQFHKDFGERSMLLAKIDPDQPLSPDQLDRYIEAHRAMLKRTSDALQAFLAANPQAHS